MKFIFYRHRLVQFVTLLVRSEPKCSYFVIVDAACTLLRVQRQEL
jgi:hypothetical protein